MIVALVASTAFNRTVTVAALKVRTCELEGVSTRSKDDRCYSQESLYSQGYNLARLTKADDRRITRMKT